MTPSARCSAREFRRNTQLATVIHCKYIRHGTRIPKAMAGQTSNDQADLEQVHQTTRRRRGIPESKVNPSDPTRPSYDAAKFRAGHAEFNGPNCILGDRRGEEQAEWLMVHCIQQVGSMWRSEARALPLSVGRCLRGRPSKRTPRSGVTLARHTADPA